MRDVKLMVLGVAGMLLGLYLCLVGVSIAGLFMTPICFIFVVAIFFLPPKDPPKP